MPILNKNIKIILNYVAGPLVFCILAYAIHLQIKKQADWEESLHKVLEVFRTPRGLQLIPVVLLMFVNWGIEARKWQLALRNTEKLSFLKSFRAIFSGTTMAFFTPNRIGEYLGRMLHLKNKDRIPSIALTVVCSISQLLVTLAAGTIGLIILHSTIAETYSGLNIGFWINLLLYLLVGATLVLTIFYFRVGWLVKWIDRLPGMNRWLKYISVVEGFNATILLRILSLSITRYFVFIAQYFLLFNVFEVGLDWWQTFWSVSVVFLVIAIIPSVALFTELGVRWNTSIEVLHLFSSNTAGILAVSLAAWIINLVVPALIGSLLIFGLKFFNNR